MLRGDIVRYDVILKTVSVIMIILGLLSLIVCLVFFASDIYIEDYISQKLDSEFIGYDVDGDGILDEEDPDDGDVIKKTYSSFKESSLVGDMTEDEFLDMLRYIVIAGGVFFLLKGIFSIITAVLGLLVFKNGRCKYAFISGSVFAVFALTYVIVSLGIGGPQIMPILDVCSAVLVLLCTYKIGKKRLTERKSEQKATLEEAVNLIE